MQPNYKKNIMLEFSTQLCQSIAKAATQISLENNWIWSDNLPILVYTRPNHTVDFFLHNRSTLFF